MSEQMTREDVIEFWMNYAETNKIALSLPGSEERIAEIQTKIDALLAEKQKLEECLDGDATMADYLCELFDRLGDMWSDAFAEAAIKAKLGTMAKPAKVRKARSPNKPKPAPDLEELVYGHLDSDGMTLGEIKTASGIDDSKVVVAVLQQLIPKGKVYKTGEKRGTRYAKAAFI